MRQGQPRGGRGGRPTFEERQQQNSERFEDRGNRGGYQRGGGAMMMGGGGRGQNRGGCDEDFDRINRGG